MQKPRTEVIGEGILYKHFRWHNSWVHLTRIDLYKRQVRPVLVGTQFPFKMNMPILKAIHDGALSAVTGGYNMQTSHHHGTSDQPLHALVVDREIWTTGIGAGGFGLQFDPTQGRCQQNRFEIRVWREGFEAVAVEHVNFGHDGHVVAFTPRGGTNEYAREGRYYTMLTTAGPWQQEGDKLVKDMLVLQETVFVPPATEGIDDWIILESRWPLKGMRPGTAVRWSQRPGVSHVVSGWPQLLHNGENIVKYLQLDPQKPKGPDGWFVRPNPRTAVGVNEFHNAIYLCAVEGRVPNSYRPHDNESDGLRLKEFATMLLAHDVTDAINLDGGGSAFMWAKDRLTSPGCYNASGEPEGLRPDHYVVAAF